MLYTHKNNRLLIEGSTGKVYKDNELLFKGNSYVAIKLFIKNSDNNENVLKMFEAQLTSVSNVDLMHKQRVND